MANKEHLAILRQGVKTWNAWRAANPEVRPDLIKAKLRGAKLRRADLFGAVLREADLNGAVLREADLNGTDMFRADLSAADLFGADLSAADLNGADLSTANLCGAVLREAYLNNADLRGANLRGANLRGANVREAHLYLANLREANLSAADLREVNLSGAALSEAHLYATVFGAINLSTTKGLDAVTHDGPSTVGIDTLVRSTGKIPASFLRGCGVPESLIEYLPSLIGAMQPIQFYSCFISYSTKDEAFAKRLHSKMRDNNLRVWFANEDLKGGYKLHEQIDEAIRVYDKLILILSPESLRSKWVMSEVRRTRKAELANNQRKFFPIALLPYKELEQWECLDPETGTDLAAEIREYYVPDFRDWKDHDAFERAFAQLLEGLKAVDAPPAPRIDPKDMPQEPAKIIARLKQRLAILEEQAAITGISVRPEVAIEIGDLRARIRELSSAR